MPSKPPQRAAGANGGLVRGQTSRLAAAEAGTEKVAETIIAQGASELFLATVAG
jgi:hypothetical protein